MNRNDNNAMQMMSSFTPGLSLFWGNYYTKGSFSTRAANQDPEFDPASVKQSISRRALRLRPLRLVNRASKAISTAVPPRSSSLPNRALTGPDVSQQVSVIKGPGRGDPSFELVLFA